MSGLNRRGLTLLLVLAVFFSGSVTGAWFASYTGQTARAAEEGVVSLPVEKMREFAEVFGRIRGNYVEDVPPDRLIEQALRGMVASLDPHSAYLSEADLANFQRGLTGEEYGGVGTYIGTRDGWIEIIAPIYGTPAQRAGLRSGDLILKIDGVSTQGMKIEDAVEKMRGVIDTLLTLEVLSTGGQPRRVDLVREKIVTPSVMSSLVKGGYGYLRITRFQDNTMNNLVTNLNGMYEENGGPLAGIVLDLRNNPGGYLFAGIGAASIFLPPGERLVSDKGRAQEEKVFVADDKYHPALENKSALEKVPMVVLVNNGTASAAEIVSGALQDHRRGVLLGKRTYGKASVQTVVPLNASNGRTALRLTMARYFTPLGRNIQARGISPDIEISINGGARAEEGESFSLREGDIPGHLENSSEDPATAQGEGEDFGERPPFIAEEDYQYSQAMLVLQALSIADPE